MPNVYHAVDVVAKDTLRVTEYIGNVASRNSKLSVNVGRISAPTEEKFYRPEFDEHVAVLSGEVHLYVSQESKVVVSAGESTTLVAGEEVKWCWPGPCEYVHIRLPAVEPDYHRRESKAAAEVLPGGEKIIATSSDNVVKIWDSQSKTLLRTFEGHDNQVMSVSFSKDGKTVATASTDRTAKIWSVDGTDTTNSDVGWPAEPMHQSRRAGVCGCMQTLSGHTGPVYTAAFSPCSTKVVTASQDRTAKLWSPATGECYSTFIGHEKQVHQAEFSPDGTNIATASDDGSARLWDVQTGASVRVFRGHTAAVYGATVSPDGTMVATASADNSARIWSVETGDCLRTLLGHTSWVRAAKFSPTGDRLITASGDNNARIWKCTNGDCALTLMGHTDWLRTASFSEDGQQVVTSSKDGTARIWCAKSGCLLRKLQHAGWVRSVAFAPEGIDAGLDGLKPVRMLSRGLSAP